MQQTAMILAAGFGTRLKKLTTDKPKALVEWQGKPLLWHIITKLKSQGFEKMVVNVHHFGEQIMDYLQKNDFDVEIYISDERKEILDTGGAIFFAQEFLKTGDNFLVHNVDIISNINLNKMLETHIRQENIATLAVRNRNTKRKLCFDKKMQLAGRESNDTLSRHCNSFAFSGIQFISTKIFDLTDKSGKFSLIDLYLELAPNNKIIGYPHDADDWKDMGKFEDFL